jgi:hypothetical protein
MKIEEPTNPVFGSRDILLDLNQRSADLVVFPEFTVRHMAALEIRILQVFRKPSGIHPIRLDFVRLLLRYLVPARRGVLHLAGYKRPDI